MMDLQASMRSKERSKGKKSMSQMYHYHKKLTCKDSEEKIPESSSLRFLSTASR